MRPRADILARVSAFDQLVRTPAEREALERLRAATGGTDGPMERHCLRVRRIAAELAARRSWECDSELLTVAAILHDIGLYPDVSRGGVYTADGAALARRLLAAHGWDRARIDRCAAAIDRHHDLRPQRRLGDEVEALRLADLIDVSGGRLRFGLDRTWMQELQRTVPRTGFGGELAREVGRALRERPLTLPRIFLRR
jgi:putative nucleotidyltransferase with HDIG domain